MSESRPVTVRISPDLDARIDRLVNVMSVNPDSTSTRSDVLLRSLEIGIEGLESGWTEEIHDARAVAPRVRTLPIRYVDRFYSMLRLAEMTRENMRDLMPESAGERCSSASDETPARLLGMPDVVRVLAQQAIDLWMQKKYTNFEHHVRACRRFMRAWEAYLGPSNLRRAKWVRTVARCVDRKLPSEAGLWAPP